MRYRISFFVTLGFLVCGSRVSAQISKEVKESIVKRVDDGDNVSIVVAFIEDEKVDFFSYGKTALENGTRVNENTVYEIGSISKVFTTILLADEIIKGNMALEDPISKYLPDTLKIPERGEKQITLIDLATHTSALPRMPNNFTPADAENPFKDYSIQQVYDFLSSYQLTRDIGEAYEYSNYGMGLLGHILELHSGKSYEELVVKKIAKELEMDNTRRTFSDNMLAHLAKGHAFGEEVKNWDIISLAGAGGIRSTAKDMAKFIKANMGTSTGLSSAMQLSHITAFKSKTGDFSIGLGWHYAGNGEILWHNGGTGGYKSFAGFNSEKNTGVVVLTNSTESVDDLGIYLLGGSKNLKASNQKDRPEEVAVSDAILEKYVGVYELAPTFKITITRKENKLFLQATNQPKFRVYPSSETVFFLKVVDANIEFNADADGKIAALTLNQNGQSINGKKIE
ncbi:serine hydrolase [Croceitalea marina]|uniref:Beta-lactamase n=1 Tax=Croceitalea marina TaxID=1775166 RepID=A0ABW5N0Y6_9FLAO